MEPDTIATNKFQILNWFEKAYGFILRQHYISWCLRKLELSRECNLQFMVRLSSLENSIKKKSCCAKKLSPPIRPIKKQPHPVAPCKKRSAFLANPLNWLILRLHRPRDRTPALKLRASNGEIAPPLHRNPQTKEASRPWIRRRNGRYMGNQTQKWIAISGRHW